MTTPCTTEMASRHPGTAAWQTIRALNVADDVYRRKEALEEIRQRLLHFLKGRGVAVRKGDVVEGVIAFAADAGLLVADIVPVRRALQLRNEVRYNAHVPSVDAVAAAADAVEAFCERFVVRPQRMPTVTLRGPVPIRVGTGVRTATVVVVKKRVVTGDSA